MPSAMRRVTLPLVSLLLACGPDTVADDGGATTSASTGSTTADSTSPSTGAVASTSTSSTDETTDDPSAGFIGSSDVGPGSACNPYVDGCPIGFKCRHIGPSYFGGVRCVPVVDDPVPVGEPCMSLDGSDNTNDDCERGAICITGTCRSYCTSAPPFPNEYDLMCEDPNTWCDRTAGGNALAVCIPSCHPLQGDCPADEGCYPVADGFQCALDASGGVGTAGDRCELINDCAQGTFCTFGDVVPDCAGSIGCCSSFCTIGDDSPCLPGQVCQPWFERGEAPPSYEDVGACMLP